MFGNLLFVLTSLAYIALAIMNLQKINATGERLVGWSMIGFGLIAVYVITSLLLTISVASRGGFDWLSPSPSTRKLLIGLLWLGMAAGVAFCAMLSTEFSLDRTTGIVRTLSLPVYFGSIWLPLLMLVPYAILLNPQWRDSLSPSLYKVPLIAAGVLGVAMMMMPRIVTSMGISVPQQTRENWNTQNLIQSIQQETSFDVLIKYSNDEDKQVRQLAADKLKSDPQWENHLIQQLQHTDEYGHHEFFWAYVFMDQNKVEHPDRFVEPINNTLPAIAAEVTRVLEKSFLYTGDLSALNIDVVCRVMNQQFSSYSNVFQHNMLTLQEALNTPPTHQSDMSQEFADLLHSYKEAVRNWLESPK